MKNFVQEGDTMELTAPYDRTSGQGALVGSMFGVACVDVLSGVAANFMVEGVFDLTKKAADAPTQGQLLYWDDTNKYVTVTATANTKIGVAAQAAAGADATVRVRLNSAF